MGIFKKSGGGFLNGVEGVINAITFNTKTFTSKKGNDYTKLSAELQVTVDGAEEPVQQFLDAGFFYPDNQTLSEDSTTIMGLDDDGNAVELTDSPLRDDTEFAKFINSLIAGGFPEEALGIGANFNPVVGARVRFSRVVDAEATKTLGKRKGKDGKEYNRDLLLVDAVLAMPEVKAAKGKAKAKTAAPKAAGKKAAPAAADTDRADEVLSALIGESKDGTIERKSLGATFVRYALKNGIAQDERKAIQAQFADESYLAGAEERGVVVLTDTAVAAAA